MLPHYQIKMVYCLHFLPCLCVHAHGCFAVILETNSWRFVGHRLQSTALAFGSCCLQGTFVDISSLPHVSTSWHMLHMWAQLLCPRTSQRTNWLSLALSHTHSPPQCFCTHRQFSRQKPHPSPSKSLYVPRFFSLAENKSATFGAFPPHSM